MFAFADRPLSIRGVWSASIRLYFNSIGKVWYLALVFGLVLAFQKHLISYLSHITVLYGQIEIMILVFLFLAIVSAFITPIIICIMYAVATDQPTDLPRFVRYVGQRYGKLLLTILMLYALLFLVSFPISIFGYIFGIFLIFSLPCALFDDVGPFAALWMSCKMVWGNWLRVFSLLFPIVILTVLTILWSDTLFVANSFAGVTANAMLYCVLLPFISAVWLNTYIDIILRHLAKSPKPSPTRTSAQQNSGTA